MGRLWEYDEEELIELYNEGQTFKQIALKLGRTESAVTQKVNSLAKEGRVLGRKAPKDEPKIPKKQGSVPEYCRTCKYYRCLPDYCAGPGYVQHPIFWNGCEEYCKNEEKVFEEI